MKKMRNLTLAAMMVLSLAACSSQSAAPAETSQTAAETTAADTITDETTVDETEAATEAEPDTITVSTLNGSREEIELEVPYNPDRVATLELASLDILDNLGLGDRVIGVPSTTIEYLQKYLDDDSLFNFGTLKEPNFEALMEAEPDIIFIGGRMSSFYDELAKIAPVVYIATDVELGVVESTSQNAKMVASIFGEEEKIDALLEEYNTRIAALQEFAEGKNAIVGMVNAGGFNLLGNDGRCSIIGTEIGFENIGVDANVDTSTHGNEASFEFLVSVDPDYIFIMDRDAAIGTEGAKLATEVMDNELVHMTSASQNDNIVILANSNVWYTAEGGITALGIMLSDLESELLN